MGMIYVIGAAKGGTGKTVTTYNLAYSLMTLGKRVLAVDMDLQANMTTCFGIENIAEVEVMIGHLLIAVLDDEELPEASEYIWERNGVDFIPASMMLSGVEAKLRLEMGAEKMLGRVLDKVKDDYDSILIDTSPSMGMLTMCDGRTNLCKTITGEVQDAFDGKLRVFESMIPNTVKVGESVYYSEPLLEYAKDTAVCEAYYGLAKEIVSEID